MDKLKAIIVDVDGTLADHGGRRNIYDGSKAHLDDPIMPVVHCVKAMYLYGYSIIIVSGREDKYREVTDKFLDMHLTDAWYNNPLPRKLLMRKSGDTRRDSIVKREIYDNEILPHYEVLFALDDRDQVVTECWRAIPIPCFQVRPGAF